MEEYLPRNYVIAQTALYFSRSPPGGSVRYEKLRLCCLERYKHRHLDRDAERRTEMRRRRRGGTAAAASLSQCFEWVCYNFLKQEEWLHQASNGRTCSLIHIFSWKYLSICALRVPSPPSAFNNIIYMKWREGGKKIKPQIQRFKAHNCILCCAIRNVLICIFAWGTKKLRAPECVEPERLEELDESFCKSGDASDKDGHKRMAAVGIKTHRLGTAVDLGAPQVFFTIREIGPWLAFVEQCKEKTLPHPHQVHPHCS